MYAIKLPSGEILKEVFSGVEKKLSIGIRSVLFSEQPIPRSVIITIDNIMCARINNLIRQLNQRLKLNANNKSCATLFLQEHLDFIAYQYK